jgi:hypothetical protein
MLVFLCAAIAYDTMPVLNVSCPPYNLSAATSDCVLLGVVSSHECACACLGMANCITPRCARAGHSRICEDYGDCEDVCVCGDGVLCTHRFTPQSTLDLRKKIENMNADHTPDIVFAIGLTTPIVLFMCFAGYMAFKNLKCYVARCT